MQGEPAELSLDRPALLSTSDLEAFRRLFLEWLDQADNREALEAGGTGHLEGLAIAVQSWIAQAKM